MFMYIKGTPPCCIQHGRLITRVSVLQILLYYLWSCQKDLKQLIPGSCTGYTWSYLSAISLRRYIRPSCFLFELICSFSGVASLLALHACAPGKSTKAYCSFHVDTCASYYVQGIGHFTRHIKYRHVYKNIHVNRSIHTPYTYSVH